MSYTEDIRKFSRMTKLAKGTVVTGTSLPNLPKRSKKKKENKRKGQ